MMTAIHEDNLFAAIIKGSVVLLLLFSLSGLAFFSSKTALGIFAGGAIGIANFLWMRNMLRRILGILPANPGRHAAMGFVARMTVMAMVLYLLLVSGCFSLVGLLVGLSIIVITIMTLSIHGALHARS
jgi:hypothetical protein